MGTGGGKRKQLSSKVAKVKDGRADYKRKRDRESDGKAAWNWWNRNTDVLYR